MSSDGFVSVVHEPVGEVRHVVGVPADRVRLGMGLPVELVVRNAFEHLAGVRHLLIELGQDGFGVHHRVLLAMFRDVVGSVRVLERNSCGMSTSVHLVCHHGGRRGNRHPHVCGNACTHSAIGNRRIEPKSTRALGRSGDAILAPRGWVHLMPFYRVRSRSLNRLAPCSVAVRSPSQTVSQSGKQSVWCESH